jgi:SAM-dependent methyltransferase
MNTEKQAVHDFWNAASCGEDLYLRGAAADYAAQSRSRYELEPYIETFADFGAASGKDLLEIGVGLGSDHERFAAAGARMNGVDLTARAIEHTRTRLHARGLKSDLQAADAEALPFADASFDIVYSWGVLHHTPNTPKAIDEVWRVLRPGGYAKIMIYHTFSMVGYMLWVRYALLAARPWRTLKDIYANNLESPGTKAYSTSEARKLFARFENVEISTVLTHGDLLTSEAGQRHRGAALSVARALWPRRLIRGLLPNHGLFMLITAKK